MRFDKQRYVSPAASMVVYLGLGEKEKALKWLEKCCEDRDTQCWFLRVDPLYDSLRHKPRFQDNHKGSIPFTRSIYNQALTTIMVVRKKMLFATCLPLFG